MIDEQKIFQSQLLDGLNKIAEAMGYDSVVDMPREKAIETSEEFLNGLLNTNDMLCRVYLIDFFDENAGRVSNIVCLNSEHVPLLKNIFKEEIDADFEKRVPSELCLEDVPLYIKCLFGLDVEEPCFESAYDSIVSDVSVCADEDGIVTKDAIVKIIKCYADEIGNMND
jgi:hypothetical protein